MPWEAPDSPVLLHRISSPLGDLTAASDGEALTGLWFVGQKRDRCGVPADAAFGDAPVFCETEAWLERYFAGDEPGELPSLRPAGTAFQMAVWGLLTELPRGETVTYGALARRLSVLCGGRTQSPQAVGGAVGRNPISILIPCHRVIGANGLLTGYAGGLWRKEALLRLERETQ